MWISVENGWYWYESIQPDVWIRSTCLYEGDRRQNQLTSVLPHALEQACCFDLWDCTDSERDSLCRTTPTPFATSKSNTNVMIYSFPDELQPYFKLEWQLLYVSMLKFKITQTLAHVLCGQDCTTMIAMVGDSVGLECAHRWFDRIK